ncbi:hypothetical protein K3495_g876 [Podosphaera aphanis]|nr:hypothetical protein K3495_g876 [Podosphaera aphanis]
MTTVITSYGAMAHRRTRTIVGKGASSPQTDSSSPAETSPTARAISGHADACRRSRANRKRQCQARGTSVSASPGHIVRSMGELRRPRIRGPARTGITGSSGAAAAGPGAGVGGVLLRRRAWEESGCEVRISGHSDDRHSRCDGAARPW